MIAQRRDRVYYVCSARGVRLTASSEGWVRAEAQVALDGAPLVDPSVAEPVRQAKAARPGGACRPFAWGICSGVLRRALARAS